MRPAPSIAAPAPPPPAALPARARRVAADLFEAAAAADLSAAIDAATWAVLRDSGLLMAPFPVPMGGEGLLTPERRDDLFAVLRAIGWGDLPVGRLFEGHVNAVDLVCRYGTPDQARRLARDVAGGALTGVWGAEDAKGLSITRADGGWRLDGRKILASGAGILARPVVTARGPEGQVMLLPRLGAGERADVSGWTAQGMRATASGAVDFSGLVASDDQILGKAGDFMRQPHFSGGAWRFCAVHLGGMERLVDLFRSHLVERGRGGDPYQLQRIAQCVAATTGAAFWIADAGRRLAADADADRVVAFVNMTRMVTERAALDVLEAVHRGVGLQGFVRPHPVERVSRDLGTYLRQPVPDLAMADAARAVLASPEATAGLWSTAP